MKTEDRKKDVLPERHPFLKAKLSVSDQLILLEQSGISFSLFPREDARQFLQDNTYLFKIKSYAKNYPRSLNTGRYQNVDFAYLVELSRLDTYFRDQILTLTLAIEHQLKVMLMRDLTENDAEDGYTIIQELFEAYPFIREEMHHRKVCESSVLSDKYYPDLPVWVFLEVCTFGSFIRLLNLYYTKYRSRRMDSVLRLLYAVRFLRNAAAHNNCLLNSLKDPYKRDRTFRPNRQLQKFLIDHGFAKASLNKKLANPLFHDFAAALLLFSMTCASKPMYHAILSDFETLFSKRFIKHQEYFKNYPLITSYYHSAVKLIALFQKIR